jgi:predicted nucleic acid-binding protein
MPRYLADTSAWYRSGRVAERWSELIEENELALCAPVRLELLYSARGRADYLSLEEDLGGFPHLAIDERVEEAALRGQRSFAARGQHRGPTPVDLLIAAVAEAHAVTLLHYDRHFDLIARATGQPAEWLARRGSLD